MKVYKIGSIFNTRNNCGGFSVLVIYDVENSWCETNLCTHEWSLLGLNTQQKLDSFQLTNISQTLNYIMDKEKI